MVFGTETSPIRQAHTNEHSTQATHSQATSIMMRCTVCGFKGPRAMCRPCHTAFVEGNRFIAESVKGGGAFATEATRQMGTHAEQRFIDMCAKKGFPMRPATSYENRRLHFDFIVKKTNVMFSRVEVKAMKASWRGGPPNPNIIYVETKNIIGEKGWVYGAADEIAFEQPWGFLIVPRKALVAMTEYYRKKARRAERSGIPYTVYGRKDRNDEVLLLQTSDLYSLSVQKLV